MGVRGRVAGRYERIGPPLQNIVRNRVISVRVVDPGRVFRLPLKVKLSRIEYTGRYHLKKVSIDVHAKIPIQHLILDEVSSNV